MAGTFAVLRRIGTPTELVSELPDPAGRRLACLCFPSRAGLVLGSAQDAGTVDLVACEAAGVEVVRRRSGGGALLVAPDCQVWLDVFLPAGDSLVKTDVSRAPWWLGEVWVAALGSVASSWGLVAAGSPGGKAGSVPRSKSGGGGALEVHRGPVVGRFARTVCIAGIGPGEVHACGMKVVGISQRRSRLGTWQHSMALVGCSPGAVLSFLELRSEAREVIARQLAASAAALDTDPHKLAEALIAALAVAPRVGST